jgi:hypothetical protein
MSDKKPLVKLLAVIALTLTSALVAIVLPFVMAIPVMLLWNYTIPDVFHLPDITYLQAVCLYFLTGILVKGNFSKLAEMIARERK